MPVLCVAPVFGQPVAELALGLALAAARDIPSADADVRRGREVLFGGENERAFLLAGKTIGLVGLGNLGRSLLPLLRPFGGPILAHDPWLPTADVARQGVEPVALDELFRRSRVVFVLAPPTTENAGMIGSRAARCARRRFGGRPRLAAPVVDWDALLDAAESGRIRVAIDVFPEEPIPRTSARAGTPNTILSAHRAGNVPEIWPTIGEMVADDLESILAGRRPSRMQVADAETVGRLRSRPIAP